MEEPESNGFSTASMVLGIVSIVLPGLTGIGAAIISLIMRAAYKKKNGDNSQTIAGKITSIIGITVSVLEYVLALMLVMYIVVLFIIMCG
ncbi:MAG: hypothetical protein ACI4EN_08215 [Butyrivibrio sp.]